jgi:hypothetical protein
MRFSCPFRVFSPRTRRPRRRPPASCPSSRPPRYRRLTHNGARRAARQAEHPGGWSSLNAPREELSDVRQLADRIGADITMDSRDRGRECCSPMERGVCAQRPTTLAWTTSRSAIPLDALHLSIGNGVHARELPLGRSSLSQRGRRGIDRRCRSVPVLARRSTRQERRLYSDSAL